MTPSIVSLEQVLKHHFATVDYLETALTHSSVGKNNNERLEFLGDAILNFVVGEYLFQHFSEADEGQLSRMRATLVKGDALIKLAKKFYLENHMILGPGEKHAKYGCRSSILAGAVEAIIGAIYLDSDFATCQTCILDWYKEDLDNMTLDQRHIDAKTQLQELLQAKKYALPIYTILQKKDDGYRQIFTVECRVEAFDQVTEGQGKNRRQAEQAAAEEMLKHIG